MRERYEQLLAGGPTFRGETQAALCSGNLALTSTRFSTAVVGANGQPMTRQPATVEVARHQPGGAQPESGASTSRHGVLSRELLYLRSR